MNPSPAKSDSTSDTVSLYVEEFQRRFRDFERARQEELRHMRHDFIVRAIGDHILLGDKVSYDCMLQGMLKEDERERLEIDPHFTRAWRIFVDLCWLKRQLLRAALIVGGIVLVLLATLLCFFALPYVAGPGHK
ncbi:MAG TPA: hypothetical protein VNL17_03455 [Verrucomicrobiae bacterium]|nr:hypothetical protein [Verrucomicrobiae bacterium]